MWFLFQFQTNFCIFFIKNNAKLYLMCHFIKTVFIKWKVISFRYVETGFINGSCKMRNNYVFG